MKFLHKYGYCFTAGAFAAGGSFFGKMPSILSALIFMKPDNFFLTHFLVHIIPLVLMVVCNIMNWRYFLKALQFCDQSLTATVLAAASNYLLSFLLGALIFREPFTLLSAIGLLLILSGLWCLCDTTTEEKPKVH